MQRSLYRSSASAPPSKSIHLIPPPPSTYLSSVIIIFFFFFFYLFSPNSYGRPSSSSLLYCSTIQPLQSPQPHTRAAPKSYPPQPPLLRPCFGTLHEVEDAIGTASARRQSSHQEQTGACLRRLFLVTTLDGPLSCRSAPAATPSS